jgi:hypothetical protein
MAHFTDLIPGARVRLLEPTGAGWRGRARCLARRSRHGRTTSRRPRPIAGRSIPSWRALESHPLPGAIVAGDGADLRAVLGRGAPLTQVL